MDETVDPPGPTQPHLVKLACIDDDAQGQTLEVLWEHELDARPAKTSWDELTSREFDPPRLFAAYLNTLRWNCVTSTNPNLFQSPFRAGIRLDSYQIEPLAKALCMPRVNLFIADDVGLGKTIEAGLIARELLIRKKVNYIVVACPPSMLSQWQDELSTRFGLQFEILDKEWIQTIRQRRGFSANPFAAHSRFLISHRLLIDETYAAPLRDFLGESLPGSLLILDEAHHAAPSSGAQYSKDSEFTKKLRDIAPRFEHRLFLSATPHNGHSSSFTALLELLDPQRFIRGTKPSKTNLADVMVRRLKEDLRQIQGGFPERKVIQLDLTGLPADSPDLLLPELLDQYDQLRRERLRVTNKHVQSASALLISNLQQRLLSSIPAFVRTLAVRNGTARFRYTNEYSCYLPSRTLASSTPWLSIIR